MAGDDEVQFNWRTYERFGSPSERTAFLAGRESALTDGDHEERLRALETGHATIQTVQQSHEATLAAMQRDVHEGRAEQKAANAAIVAKLEAMSIASAEGRGAAAEAARQAAARKWIIGLIAVPAIGITFYVADHFVRDRTTNIDATLEMKP